MVSTSDSWGVICTISYTVSTGTGSGVGWFRCWDVDNEEGPAVAKGDNGGRWWDGERRWNSVSSAMLVSLLLLLLL